MNLHTLHTSLSNKWQAFADPPGIKSVLRSSIQINAAYKPGSYEDLLATNMQTRN